MAGNHSRDSSFAIEIPASNPFRIPHHQPAFYAALPDRQRLSPMSTPNVREVPPPPLPPPRWVEDIGNGGDAGWTFENQGSASRFETSSATVRAGSSLLGGYQTSPARAYNGPQKQIELDTSSSQASLGYKGDQADSSSKDMRIPDLRELLEFNKLQSEQQMGQKTLERSSQAYDKQLLSRIGGSRAPQPRADNPNTGSLGEDTTTGLQTPSQKAKGPLRPLAVPERRHSEMDGRGSPRAPAAWAPSTPGSAPPTSVASPRLSGLRSPLHEHTQPQQQRPASRMDDTAPIPGRLIQRDSCDHGNLSEHDYVAHSPAMQLTQAVSPAGSDDYQQSRTGQKRRAQSPPADSSLDPRLPAGVNAADAWQRRQLQTVAGRNLQPPARFQTPSSLSSNGSANALNASFPSSYAMSNPSSATQYSADRSPPNSFQIGDLTNMNNTQTMMSAPAPPDATTAPPIPTRRSTNPNMQRAPGLWICDCCPKKPKKFESEDELRIHEMEKQYICQYCNNRFKNKNEAERHQNSLHLRRHSWSCAALTSFEAAFHATPSNSVMAALQGSDYSSASGITNPGAYPGLLHSGPSDTCGYCGIDFPNPPNWDDRVEHLNHVHKFGECNQSKKFFRADHFRQHLKHSHAGTSGKWTNMLENACMKDEPPPVPINQQQLPPGMPGITMVGQQQLLAAAAAAAAAGVGQGSMSAYGDPGMSQSGLGSPQSHNMTLSNQLGLGLMGLEHPSGQQAIMNATGPMGGGGPGLAPIASMTGPGQGYYSAHQPHQQQ